MCKIGLFFGRSYKICHFYAYSFDIGGTDFFKVFDYSGSPKVVINMYSAKSSVLPFVWFYLTNPLNLHYFKRIKHLSGVPQGLLLRSLSFVNNFQEYLI